MPQNILYGAATHILTLFVYDREYLPIQPAFGIRKQFFSCYPLQAIEQCLFVRKTLLDYVLFIVVAVHDSSSVIPVPLQFSQSRPYSQWSPQSGHMPMSAVSESPLE